MKQKMLDQMAAVTEAQYLIEHIKIKPILAQEAALRGKLAKLDAQIKESREQAANDDAMRMLGADILWRGWHSRSRRQLNIELAQITAQKLTVMDQVRKAFGKKYAVQTMADDERKRTKLARARQLEDSLLNHVGPSLRK